MEVVESSFMLTSNKAFANPQTVEISGSRCGRRGQSYMGRTHEPQRSLACKHTAEERFKNDQESLQGTLYEGE